MEVRKAFICAKKLDRHQVVGAHALTTSSSQGGQVSTELSASPLLVYHNFLITPERYLHAYVYSMSQTAERNIECSGDKGIVTQATYPTNFESETMMIPRNHR